MKPESILLQLILQKLGIEFKIDTKNDRIRLQKIVYLLQRCGVNLGYNYGWYIYGPYSRELTSVYYDLDASLKSNEKDYTWYKLDEGVDELKNGIEKFKEISKIPGGVSIVKDPTKSEDVSWLEFIASIDYLHNSPSRPTSISEEDIRAFTQKEKGKLVGNFDQSYNIALSVLKGIGLAEAAEPDY
jgi:hypothetical protein